MNQHDDACAKCRTSKKTKTRERKHIRNPVLMSKDVTQSLQLTIQMGPSPNASEVHISFKG
jgi:hypothetical protein